MTFSLEFAQVYDCECLPNVFTLHAEALHSDVASTWEISQYRDDRQSLREWFNWLNQTQTPMIGFYSIQYDYPLIHYLWTNPQATYADLYAKSQELIKSDDQFAHTIWDRDRFAPQIDLFKIHHFDNKAKRTSLKALQCNMRWPNVRESKLPFDVPVQYADIDGELIPYNKSDTASTKRFAHISMKAIEFRIGLIEQFGLDVMNYSDVKIGAKIFEQKLGEDICYDRSSGRKQPRQTVRRSIPLANIIFPYIRFQNPEFNRVLEWMRAQTLTPDDLDDPDAPIKTKGVFKGLVANVGGLDFHFGTGGMHASVEPQRVIATDEWFIRDIDVKALYPSIAIANRLAPAHLGEVFINTYPTILEERAKHAKGTPQNSGFKLAANGPWGQSNNKYTIFFDPQYAMTIPINGQLMICMLAEWLLTVPTLKLIQVNTDGITYYIHRDHVETAKALEKQWEAYTLLKLEDASYKRMFIRDVNNYVAEDMDGKLKQKGAYWHPETGDRYFDSISEQSPPAWHKDMGSLVTIQAAVAAMVHGIDPETFIRAHSDPFDFMRRVKVDKQSHLYHGEREVQRTTRYYIAKEGAHLVKVSPPKGVIGEYKRANKLSDAYFNSIAATLAPGTWDERIHTKNKGKYEIVRTAIEAGWKVAECNDASTFRFDNVDYNWYVIEAKKLII